MRYEPVLQVGKNLISKIVIALIGLLLMTVTGYAQQFCADSIHIEGTIRDPSGAAVRNAQVQTSDNQTARTDDGGHFLLPCVPANAATLTIQAEGFAPLSKQIIARIGESVHLSLQLTIAVVETGVQVTADAGASNPERGPGAKTLSTEEVRQLPDDPDDLLQQLQLMASTGGGGSGAAAIVVDGFQNGSALPPKSSIAAIRVNPDPISPEYERPDSSGGRVEIITKPGAGNLHGALFFTDSNGSFNATDPFSVTATPAGKRRFGFELSGPIIAKKSGFALALETRKIDEFNVVDAITLDANLNQIAQHETVAAPQRLWIGSARGDWQVTEKDTATLSYAANVNDHGNQGVGGIVLPEAGYSSRVAEYDLRFTNSYIANANLLHETRIGYTWKRTEQLPNSIAPALQISGFFNGGGVSSQNLNHRERDLEIDDDVLMTHGRHELKFGVQSLGLFVHDYNPDTFNGAYVFGGGSAPILDAGNNPTGKTTTITAIEQYRRALLSLPGGTPTTYQLTAGNPVVPYTQWRVGVFAQDTFKFLPRLTLAGGLRYSFQTAPSTFVNFDPRLGLAWSPDKKSRWSIHLRAGAFSVPVDTSDAAQVNRLNGVRQRQITVYSPDFNNPLRAIAGSIPVQNVWQFTHAFEQIPVGEVSFGIEADLPHQWHPSLWYSWFAAWGDPRTVNINAPLITVTSGTPVDTTAALLAPRPGTPYLNVFQFENSAHNRGGVFWAGIDQKANKHWTLSMGLWNVNFYTNSGTPQSSYSRRGEFARPDWQQSGALFENDLKFPYKLELSTQMYWHYGRPYNITTGIDANGDGNFNDRPSYTSASGSGAYSTPFGFMTTNAVLGDVPRNLGTMPTIVHMYSNLSRTFELRSKDKEHPYTVTMNARAANLLNHTNVTAVGTVVSSPNLGMPIAAEAARRIELGLRFAF